MAASDLDRTNKKELTESARTDDAGETMVRGLSTTGGGEAEMFPVFVAAEPLKNDRESCMRWK
jgi:hypothetical protein